MSVCAVIVTYHPAAEIINNVIALLDQVDEVVIVDNGSGTEAKVLLGELSRHHTVSVIYNEQNLGIAAALNIGVRHAQAARHQWVATFDQDSKATSGMIKAMMEAYNAFPEKAIVAGLSPRYQNQSTGQIATSRLKHADPNTLPYAEVLVVMTSGNLVKTGVFETVGYFNEALFIDHVDTEFCLRCAKSGYKTLEVKDAILLHCIGFPVQHRIFGKLKTTTNHSSLRRYYIARNSIYVYRKFVFAYPAWVIQDATKLIKLMIMLMLFETQRRQKLAAMFRGFIDGALGKMGKYGG